MPIRTATAGGAARAGDVDGDGDLDLLVADGYLDQAAVPAHLYSNDGTGHFTEAPVGALPSAKNGIYPVDLDLADVDGDFDLDIYVANDGTPSRHYVNRGDGFFADNYEEQILVNDGAGHFTD